jgi:hypothetical protein
MSKKSPKKLKFIDKIDEETGFSYNVSTTAKGAKIDETIEDFKECLKVFMSARNSLLSMTDCEDSIHEFIYRNLFPYPVSISKDDLDYSGRPRIFLKTYQVEKGYKSDIDIYHWKNDYNQNIDN